VAEASAPASSGNLGPGFDTLAMALELRCRVHAEIADEWSASHVGEHCLPDGAVDGVLEAAQAVVAQPLAMIVDNDIPLSRGLGSSSAAAAAAAACALATVGSPAEPEQIFELVAKLEGHSDNAAATVYGGLIAIDGQGAPFVLDLHPRWVILVAVPDYYLSTPEARAALPLEVRREVVVRNLGRLTALIEGLKTGNADVLGRAGGDELHEAPRAGLHPQASLLIASARDAGASHAAWSGAGPSVLALCDEATQPSVRSALNAALDGQGRVIQFELASEGLTVL